MPFLWELCSIGLIYGLFRIFSTFVSPYTGAAIVLLGKPSRSVGPGLRFLLRPFEWIGQVTDLSKRTVSFSGEFESQDNNDTNLKVIYEFSPKAEMLIKYQGFREAELAALLTERIRSTLTIIIRKYLSRDQVLDSLDKISAKARETFLNSLADNSEFLPNYYGIELMAVVITDAGTPKELKDAAIQRKVVGRLNEARSSEMENAREMARALMQDAKKFGTFLDYETALNAVQVQFGKSRKNIGQYGLDRPTLDALRSTAKQIIDKRKKI